MIVNFQRETSSVVLSLFDIGCLPYVSLADTWIARAKHSGLLRLTLAIAAPPASKLLCAQKPVAHALARVFRMLLCGKWGSKGDSQVRISDRPSVTTKS